MVTIFKQRSEWYWNIVYLNAFMVFIDIISSFFRPNDLHK